MSASDGTERAVSFTRGPVDTVLPPLPADVQAELDEAERLRWEMVAADPSVGGADAGGDGGADAARRDALKAVAAHYPRCLEAWAGLAELAEDPVERYAFARVGYHRGLDALRAAGWRGTGTVRWVHRANQGFLRSVEQLRQAAGEIGEADEEDRCRLFLGQLDPGRRLPEAGSGGGPPD